MMKTGTKSVLFGVHQVIIHPLMVLWAWLIIYRSWPNLYELAAILTHDLGYWGQPNMDGPEGENHPEISAGWWRGRFNGFGDKVANEIIGHSRFHAKTSGLPLSKLFRPDKMATALYPRWLYLILANLSGEIREYMRLCDEDKHKNVMSHPESQIQWLLEVQAHLALMGIKGDQYQPVKEQMKGP